MLGVIVLKVGNVVLRRELLPQDVARLQEIDKTRQLKQGNLEELRKQIEGLEPTVEKLSALVEELHALWAEQLSVRSRTAVEISEKANRSINILVQPMGDEAHFQQVWELIGLRRFEKPEMTKCLSFG